VGYAVTWFSGPESDAGLVSTGPEFTGPVDANVDLHEVWMWRPPQSVSRNERPMQTRRDMCASTTRSMPDPTSEVESEAEHCNSRGIVRAIPTTNR
jgi:hypothetical protein